MGTCWKVDAEQWDYQTCLCKIVALDYERGAQVLTVLHGECLNVVYQHFGKLLTWLRWNDKQQNKPHYNKYIIHKQLTGCPWINVECPQYFTVSSVWSLCTLCDRVRSVSVQCVLWIFCKLLVCLLLQNHSDRLLLINNIPVRKSLTLITVALTVYFSLSSSHVTRWSQSTTVSVCGRNWRLVNFEDPSLILFVSSPSPQPPRTEAGSKNNRGQEQKKSALHQFRGKLPVGDIIGTFFPLKPVNTNANIWSLEPNYCA